MTISEIDSDHPFLDYENSIFPHLKDLDKPTLNELYQKIDTIKIVQLGLRSMAAVCAAGALALLATSQPLRACSLAAIALGMYVYAYVIQKPPPYLILSIDGGGIRGMIPMQILSQIEQELGCPIGEVFDCIAGTSIGGILALTLTQPDPLDPSKPKLGATQVVEFLEKQGPVVFEKSTMQSLKSLEGIRAPKYSNENLKIVLDNQFGTVRIDEAVTDVLIPSYDLFNGRPVIFFHFKGQNTQKLFLMKDVGMATSAAPVYFPSYAVDNLNLIDGAILANNPSLLAYMKAAGHVDPNRDIYILSIGTGQMALKSITPQQSESYGMIQWLPFIFDVIFQTAQDMLTLQFKLLKQKAPLSLVRLQPQLYNASQEQLDNTTPENIKSLKQVAIKYFQRNIGWLRQEVIQPLKKYRLPT